MDKYIFFKQKVFNSFENWKTFLELDDEVELLKMELVRQFQFQMKNHINVNYQNWYYMIDDGLSFGLCLKTFEKTRKGLEFWFEEGQFSVYTKAENDIPSYYKLVNDNVELFRRIFKVKELDVKNGGYLISYNLFPIHISNSWAENMNELVFFAPDKLIFWFDHFLEGILKSEKVIELFNQEF